MQDKFYKSIKDTREPHWKELYDKLRAQHDGVVAPSAGTGTVEDPIEISDGDTVVQQPTENSSETVSETTVADENGVKSSQSTLGDITNGVENAMEYINTTV